MSFNRSRGRNVHFYSASDPVHALGGLILNQSVTILIITSGSYSVSLRGTRKILTPSDKPLEPGHYDIRSNSPGGTISIADEPCVTRVYSGTESGRTEEFRNQVREHDGRCVITGVVHADADYWYGFEAAHIFPLSDNKLFMDLGFPRLVTNRQGEHDSGINSFAFRPDPFKVDGRVLDPICRESNDERSVQDELLRWHFCQSVLINMRGAGEPGFEMDFPGGTDMVGEILSGPEPAKRMETELSLRLNEFTWP
ncbi:hypothetical protein V1507DRAFT_498551 [Lipomyces tetrasporus]